MSNWLVVADLLSLRAEFDELAPHRDRGADGTIGDAAHRARKSDHNPDDTAGSLTPHTDTDSIPEVHALDVDSTGPWPAGMSMTKAVKVVVAKQVKLGDRCPLLYVIWDHEIFEFNNGWRPAPYNGDDPHTGHAHFSSRYGSGSGSSNPENYRGPWGLLEAFAVLSADDKKWLQNQLDNARAATLKALLDIEIGDAANPNRTIGDVLRDNAKLRGVLIGDAKDTANAKLSPSSPLARLIATLPDAAPHV